MEDSLRSIEDDSSFFERMANLIPPNIFCSEETRLQLAGQTSSSVDDELEDDMSEILEDTSPAKKKKKRKKDKGKKEGKEETALPEPLEEDNIFDHKKLYVKGLQPSVTKGTLTEMFPAAIKIDLKKKRKEKEKHKLRTSIIHFESPEAARRALDIHQGRIYQVVYARIRTGDNGTEPTQQSSQKRNADTEETNLFQAKKQKIGKKHDKKIREHLEEEKVPILQYAHCIKDNEINHKKEMKAKKLKENQVAPITSTLKGLDKSTAVDSMDTGDKNFKQMYKKEKKKQKFASKQADVKMNGGVGEEEKAELFTNIKQKSSSPTKASCSPTKAKVPTNLTNEHKSSVAVTPLPTIPSSVKPLAQTRPKQVTPVSQGLMSLLSPNGAAVLTVLDGVPMGTLSDNRAKLHAKIQELQAKRKVNDPERQKKLLKRREKKEKLKLLRKQKKKEEKKGGLNKDGTSVKNKKSENEVAKNRKNQVKQVLNKDGKLVFSKFDFSESAKKDKKKGTSLTGKDYKTLLGKIEKRNEKINKVKSRDETAGKLLQDKIKWESVINKAEGFKVKDNPEVLKKALKRKEKMKEVKKKKWDARVDHTEKMTDAKQAKRNKNIEERKQAKKDKKIKKLKKKGRMIPGF